MTDAKPKIVTHHVYPPIPTRIYDWSAHRDGYEPGDLLGQGATEAEAIADLLDQESAPQEEAPAAKPAQSYALLYVDADANGENGRTIRVPMP